MSYSTLASLAAIATIGMFLIELVRLGLGLVGFLRRAKARRLKKRP